MTVFNPRLYAYAATRLRIRENRRGKLSAIGLARWVNMMGQLASRFPNPLFSCFRRPRAAEAGEEG